MFKYLFDFGIKKIYNYYHNSISQDNKSEEVHKPVKFAIMNNIAIFSSNSHKSIIGAVEKMYSDGYILQRLKANKKIVNVLEEQYRMDKYFRCYQIISIASPIYVN